MARATAGWRARGAGKLLETPVRPSLKLPSAGASGNLALAGLANARRITSLLVVSNAHMQLAGSAGRLRSRGNPQRYHSAAVALSHDSGRHAERFGISAEVATVRHRIGATSAASGGSPLLACGRAPGHAGRE